MACYRGTAVCDTFSFSESVITSWREVNGKNTKRQRKRKKKLIEVAERQHTLRIQIHSIEEWFIELYLKRNCIAKWTLWRNFFEQQKNGAFAIILVTSRWKWVVFIVFLSPLWNTENVFVFIHLTQQKIERKKLMSVWKLDRFPINGWLYISLADITKIPKEPIGAYF